jgi:hypothetical protein
MTQEDICMLFLSIVGGYLLLQAVIQILKSEITYDVKEQLLQQSLAQYQRSDGGVLGSDALCKKPLPTDRIIERDLQPGCVYSKSNQELWKEVDAHDFSKPKGCTAQEKKIDLLRTIRNTECHGDKLMDTTRNGLINEYYNKTMLDVDMSKVDPYDPEMYASIASKVRCQTKPVKKDILKSNLPFPTEHTHVTSYSNPNPAPLHHPILSDTHYHHASVKSSTHIPSAIHCQQHPTTDKLISTNLISDHLLDQRVSGFKVTQTGNISGDMIRAKDLSYAPRDLASRYNPHDNNLYKVSSRTPVKSLDDIPRRPPCGNDGLHSSYAELEHNDLVETTSA